MDTHPRRRLDTVLDGHGGIGKAIVLAADKVFEGQRAVRQCVRVRDVRKERLLGEPELEGGVIPEERAVIEVLHAPLNGQPVTHLDHRTPFFSFQELNLENC